MAALGGSPASAFVLTDGTPAASRWTQTTVDGATGVPGDPITLTWSFVPDGTPVVNLDTFQSEPSDLIADFDATFGAGPGGADLTLRPWFDFFQQSFDRISALAGVTYVYEPNDTGSTHGTLGPAGASGIRGDVRIGGIGMDSAGGTLAYNAFPSAGGDMAIDTDDLPGLFSDATNGNRLLRNTIMHEAGHGLGLDHLVSGNAGILMEPQIDTSFDGPQHDDLRGLHWLYGDALEKGGRNETAATATSLGSLSPGGTITVGAGGSGSVIAATETDFVSITNEQDEDFFAFTLAGPATVSIEMTPRGANYEQNGQPFVTTETSNLSVALFDSDGFTQLALAGSTPAGVNESINSIALTEAGTYYARVRGPVTASQQVAQFYELSVSAAPSPPDLPGDYNLDGVVNAADYTRYRDTLFARPTPFSGADGNGNGVVESGDYTVWASAYGDTLPATAVPEPGAWAVVLAAAASLAWRRFG